MSSLVATIVLVVLAILGIAVVLGILWWLVNWMAAEWQLSPVVTKLARTVIVVGSCLIAILVIIWLLGGFGPVARWGP